MVNLIIFFFAKVLILLFANYSLKGRETEYMIQINNAKHKFFRVTYFVGYKGTLQ